MVITEGTQRIGQLEKRKGGYFYLEIDSAIINTLEQKRSTRLICELENETSYRCGLNHLGNGNFYIIIAGKILTKLQKNIGDEIHYRILLDPDQLGVEMPEVLSVLLDQDEAAKDTFDKITNGKKRSLIYSIVKIKDLDKQVNTILKFLDTEKQRLR